MYEKAFLQSMAQLCAAVFGSLRTVKILLNRVIRWFSVFMSIHIDIFKRLTGATFDFCKLSSRWEEISSPGRQFFYEKCLPRDDFFLCEWCRMVYLQITLHLFFKSIQWYFWLLVTKTLSPGNNLTACRVKKALYYPCAHTTIMENDFPRSTVSFYLSKALRVANVWFNIYLCSIYTTQRYSLLKSAESGALTKAEVRLTRTGLTSTTSSYTGKRYQTEESKRSNFPGLSSLPVSCLHPQHCFNLRKYARTFWKNHGCIKFWF